ncbi:MAG TPA: CvpA family protein [Myxococcota bacterium]|nr:CvpA family protein [Myxococcota bacterium]
MWLDLVALVLIALMAGLGAWRGGFRTGMALAALVVGYVVSVLGASPLAPTLGRWLVAPNLVLVPLAGTLLFFAGHAAVSLLRFALLRAGVASDEPSQAARWWGALLGGVRGALLVLMVAYLALWLDAVRATGRELPLSPVSDSATAHVTSAVVEAGVEAALGDAGSAGRVVARAAAQPARALTDWQAVVETPSVSLLREDAGFWSDVEQGQVEPALARPAAVRVLRDLQLRERLASLGVVSDGAARDPALFRDELIAVLRDVGPRMRGLRDDPELQQLARDPEVVGLVQSGDTMGLLAHPGVRSLVDRVAGEPTSR